MDEFEVCSNGGAETPGQTVQKPSSSFCEAPQTDADADASTAQGSSEAEAGTSGHDESYGTDDDQFSDVGEAPDTEVKEFWACMLFRTPPHLSYAVLALLSLSWCVHANLLISSNAGTSWYEITVLHTTLQ